MIGELVQRYRVTILVATPSFLQLYMRRCTPAQFGSLRLVVAGAEKLGEALKQAFEDQFGIRPLEGYGTTECAPVVAVSTLDFRGPGFYQPGSRRGYVGQPLPGVAVRIVDPDTFAPLPPATPGMLIVKGPNVMKGYLGRDDLTARVMRDGWYVTGDIAMMDEDGFLKITDPAVVAQILERAAGAGLPNLYLPRPDHFIPVERLPLLGTGKLDLREIRRIAVEGLAAPRRP